MARRDIRFRVTPKTGAPRRSLRLVMPHLAILAATAIGIVYRGFEVAAGASPAVAAAYVSNVAWSLHNAICFAPFVAAALAVRSRQALEGAR